MMNIRTRRTALIVAIGTALALAFSFVPTPAHGATTVHKLNYEGEVTCPDSNPIKGMTFDARSGHVSTQCYTQFYWDANMMGGEVFMEFDAVIRAGYTPGTAMIERVNAAVAGKPSASQLTLCVMMPNAELKLKQMQIQAT
jgi:hypothetical protein